MCIPSFVTETSASFAGSWLDEFVTVTVIICPMLKGVSGETETKSLGVGIMLIGLRKPKIHHNGIPRIWLMPIKTTKETDRKIKRKVARFFFCMAFIYHTTII